MAETWAERTAWIVANLGDGRRENVAKQLTKHLDKKLPTVAENIRLWTSGETTPGSEYIEAIQRAYPVVNPEWLITGEGSQTRTEGPPDKAVALDVLAVLGTAYAELAARYGEPTDPASGNQDAVDAANVSRKGRGTVEKATRKGGKGRPARRRG